MSLYWSRWGLLDWIHKTCKTTERCRLKSSKYSLASLLLRWLRWSQQTSLEVLQERRKIPGVASKFGCFAEDSPRDCGYGSWRCWRRLLERQGSCARWVERHQGRLVVRHGKDWSGAAVSLESMIYIDSSARLETRWLFTRKPAKETDQELEELVATTRTLPGRQGWQRQCQSNANR